jgi:hypothetical protein
MGIALFLILVVGLLLAFLTFDVDEPEPKHPRHHHTRKHR